MVAPIAAVTEEEQAAWARAEAKAAGETRENLMHALMANRRRTEFTYAHQGLEVLVNTAPELARELCHEFSNALDLVASNLRRPDAK